MPLPRSALVSLDATPVYHVVSRCVRRQFLCGKDFVTGKDFSHRRDWIRQRIFELAEIFAIDVAAYAVMSNHFHLVVCIQKDQALAWSDHEVAARWCRLFGGDSRVRTFAERGTVPEAHQAFISNKVKVYRERLYSLSWFMRCLNESIARMANAEDNVSGRFWEGRFKSQALLDEGAVLAAMAYVDLNPIRATMVKTPGESDYTSIQQRIIEHDPRVVSQEPEVVEALPEDLRTAIGKLMPFADQVDPDAEHINSGRAITHQHLADTHSVGKILPQFGRFSQALSSDFPMDGPAPSGQTGPGLVELDTPCPCPAPHRCHWTPRRSTTWSRAAFAGSSCAVWIFSRARTSPIDI